MTVTVTSRSAYENTEEIRELYTERIYTWLKDNPVSTDLDIAQGTGIPINAVPASRGNLFNNGRIIDTGKKINDSTGMQATSWSISRAPPTKPIHRKMCSMCEGKGCTLCNQEGYTEVNS